jgi:hypothetical protein
MEKGISKKDILTRKLMEQEEDKTEEKSEEKTEGGGNGNFAQLVSKLLHSRNQTHIFHLQTKSYAEHIALNNYYDGVLGLFDGLIESYQGKHGIISNYKCEGFENYKSGEQVINYLKKLDGDIDTLRKSVKESYLQNQIDTIQELINSTLYKLRFLK